MKYKEKDILNLNENQTVWVTDFSCCRGYFSDFNKDIPPYEAVVKNIDKYGADYVAVSGGFYHWYSYRNSQIFSTREEAVSWYCKRVSEAVARAQVQIDKYEGYKTELLNKIFAVNGQISS